MHRYIVALGAVLALQGCVVVPGPVVGAASDAITGEEGKHCVPSIAKIGDHVRSPDGRIGVITKLETTSTRCAGDPAHPVRAVLTFE